jgi:uncharacterized protein (TIGR02611 family)
LRWGGRQVWVFLRRILVAVVGGVIAVAGVVMSLGPGPGVLVLILGLTILATEFPWARRTLTQTKAKIRSFRRRWEMTHRPPNRQVR